MISENVSMQKIEHGSALGDLRTSEPIRVQGFGQWRDLVRENFPWLEMRNCCNDVFQAKVAIHALGDDTLASIDSRANEVTRTRRLAETAEAGFIKLMWQMDGEMVLEQDGRNCTIAAGQATVCDSARPYCIRVSDEARFTVLMLPYRTCMGWEKISPKICATRLGDTVTMRAALNALTTLVHAPPETGGTDTVLRAVQWMLSTSLHCVAASALPGVHRLQSTRLDRAYGHILEHLGDSDLDADSLATALCMSRRALYMLFKEYRLTPARMIHDIRLERCLQVLKDSRQQHRKIIDVAFDHGFNDYATFSRSFKAQYGITPSEFRAGRQPQSRPSSTSGLH